MPFPSQFLFGTANADHQVEAHDPDHEDVWDLWERTQGLTPRGRATDFSNRYEDDVAAAAAMGCKLFRFSIAWARVETSEGVFNESALAHYRRVAECVRRHGMKVMLTLHHFVWPVWLERNAGGMIGKRFPELFTRYADRVASAMGDLVDYWITFNEPSQLTFGYIKPWWQGRYYMPPGLPRGESVDEEAAAVGKLVRGLFLAHAQARKAIQGHHASAKVGVNPLVTGFPTWLQKLMDWAACHRGLSEALFKFTTRGALVHEKADVDLVIAGITRDDDSRFLASDPYLRTSKAVIVGPDFGGECLDDLADCQVGVIGVGNQPAAWKRDLPGNCLKQIFPNYEEARAALMKGDIDAVYGDAFYLLPENTSECEGCSFLVTGLSDESYVVRAPPGSSVLLDRVNRAIAVLQGATIAGPRCSRAFTGKDSADREPPLSLAEAFSNQDHYPASSGQNRSLRKIRRRGKIRVGLRIDTEGIATPWQGEGLELQLARRIAHEVMGDENLLEIVSLEPVHRTQVLKSQSSWLNWAWRFWGTTSLIANASWWYLGMRGKLAEEICPKEAIGAQDFVGLDYYWGLPTRKLHRFRSLQDAALGRFIQAPVWPKGLFNALKRYHRWFPEQEIFVVENGSVPMAGGISRTTYLKEHLAQVEKAIERGIPVRGYNYWSITSNREWGHPFDPNTDFGLYYVDLDKDTELGRVATPEVATYAEIISKRSVGRPE
jgi:beta-glucosidase/6-phospho-beta-glucosidase/beta-galactosidase